MQTQEISIPVENGSIQGDLTIPTHQPPIGLCIFAHGSGSSRFSPRNKHIADLFHSYGIATILMDLLTKEEEVQDEFTRQWRFNIQLLTGRVVACMDYAKKNEALVNLPIGLLGASTGAAAALWAAQCRPKNVACVISRGGRPDLVPKDILHSIHVPTLLIVGSLDLEVLELNRQAHDALGSQQKRIQLVQGATHLFEEPGTLDIAAKHAASFLKHHMEEFNHKKAEE